MTNFTIKTRAIYFYFYEHKRVEATIKEMGENNIATSEDTVIFNT